MLLKLLEILTCTVWLVVEKNWIHCINFTSCSSVTRSLNQTVNLEFPSRIKVTSTICAHVLMFSCSGLLPSLVSDLDCWRKGPAYVFGKEWSIFGSVHKILSLATDCKNMPTNSSREATKCPQAGTKEGLALDIYYDLGLNKVEQAKEIQWLLNQVSTMTIASSNY